MATAGRRLADAGLVLLLGGTGYAVTQAMRPPPPTPVVVGDPVPAVPPPPAAAAGPALLLDAVDARTAYRAASGRVCAGAAVPIERSRDGGRTWESRLTPLRAVTALAFDTAAVGYVGGLDGDCAASVFRTADAGETWARVPTVDEEVVALDVRAGTGWLVTRTAGGGMRLRRTTDDFGALADVTDPCGNGPAAGAPRFVSATAADAAVVACVAEPRPNGQARLLLATADAGRSWTELAGARRAGPSGDDRVDGLDADGTLAGLAAVPGGRVAALLTRARCAAGELRASADGRTWRSLGCPVAAGVPVDAVLAVSFADARTGLAVGRRGPALVTLRTADGGAVWAPV